MWDAVPVGSDAMAGLPVGWLMFPTAPSDSDGNSPGDQARRPRSVAELPKLARGAWHPFRRSFASERRHLPDVDIMAVAGWRSSRVMRESYQHSDATGMLSVVEPSESRPKPSESGTNEAQAEAK